MTSPQPPTPRVLGVDLSLTSTGLAGPGWTTTIRPGALRGADRMNHIREHLADYLTGVTLVIVEGPSYGNQSQGRQTGHHERAGLWWLVRVQLANRGLPVAVVPPATLKRYATGKGNADKATVIREVTRRLAWFQGGEDEADAAVLACLGCDALGHPLVAMPKVNREALKGVQWPEGIEVPNVS